MYFIKELAMLVYLGIFIIGFYILTKILIDFIQLKFVKQKLDSPAVILNAEDYQKAGMYAIAKLKLSIFSTIFEGLLFLIWFGFGFEALESFWTSTSLSSFWQNLGFFLGFLIIHILISLPLGFYTEMILDKRFGFSKTTLGLFVLDCIKSLVLAILFGGIVAGGVIAFIEHTSLWWLWAFLFVWVLGIVLNAIYPTILAPIFNRFTPLEDENLKQRVEGLLDSVGFKSNGVFVMDASKRDGRLNAYFGGLSKSKRVILFDTLLKNISTDGLLAVLGHELGHFKNHDILRNMVLNTVVLFLIFFLAGVACKWLLEAFGIACEGGVLACVVLWSPIVFFWIMPILGIFLRKAEYRADEFGASLSSKTTLANALIRIVNENKSFPYSHGLYVAFHYTHPPLLDRLRALEYDI